MAKKKCEECKLSFNKVYKKGSKKFCWRCYRKKFNIIGPEKATTFEEAVNKTYRIIAVHSNKKIKAGITSFPKVLVGRAFKINLIEDE